MIDFPQNARFGKKIPVAELKRQGLKSRLADGIKSLVWAYKLSPSTVQLAATEAVKEIEVMDLTVKEQLSGLKAIASVITALDQLVPNPMIFRVFNEDGSERTLAFNLKASGGALHGTSETFRLFHSEGDLCLPSGAINLETFFKSFAVAVGGMAARPGESLIELESRHYRLESLKSDLADLEKRIAKEVQFDAKYLLAKDKQKVQKELEGLR